MRASASLSFEDGIRTSSWNAMFALRTRVNMSAIGSVIVTAAAPQSVPRHHDDFVTPGISPACAICRRQIRHRPKWRYTERARPQRRQRVYARTLNFGVRCALRMRAFFAIRLPLAVAAEREAERPQQRSALVVCLRGGHD